MFLRYPQLHRTTRLTLRYPARVRLKYRKYLLRVGNHLALEQSPLHLIQLTTRMLDVVLYTRATSHQSRLRLARQLPQRLLGPLHQPLANTQIIFHTGRGRIRLTLPAYPVEGVFYTSRQMLPLTPAARLVLLRCTGRFTYQTTHRIPQQIGICRMVYIRLHHERITPTAQSLSNLFFWLFI